MMNALHSLLFFLGLTCAFTGTGICQPSDGERLAVLPFAVRNISAEQGLQLQERFTEVLGESRRFNVLAGAVVKNSLKEAGFKTVDSCYT